MVSLAGPIDADVLRVRHEFLSTPTLRLSADDVVAQLHVQPRHASLMLDALAQEGFLKRTTDGCYVRCVTREAP
jgi:predicted transcriptional regulator of viral defense system